MEAQGASRRLPAGLSSVNLTGQPTSSSFMEAQGASRQPHMSFDFLTIVVIVNALATFVLWSERRPEKIKKKFRKQLYDTPLDRPGLHDQRVLRRFGPPEVYETGSQYSRRYISFFVVLRLRTVEARPLVGRPRNGTISHSVPSTSRNDSMMAASGKLFAR
jgi:hypothetical protein